MDYSLLIGLTLDEKSLVMGIIDYMRAFTPDKYVENFVKENVFRTDSPTIVSPIQYMKRFVSCVPRYFDKVPDSWSGLERNGIFGT